MRIIVGGGISGLIWSYYNPGYTIFTDRVGGQMVDPWLGPRLLHDNEMNRKLLQDLGLPIDEDEALIGYLHEDGEVMAYCPPDLRAKYYRKSRCLEEDSVVPQSIMSGGSNVIHHLKVDWTELINRLAEKAEIETIVVDSLKSGLINHSLEFEEVIWTVPLPLLFRSLGLEDPGLRALNKLFIKVKEFHDFEIYPFDYVYVATDAYSYHRVTKIADGYVIEWTGNDIDLGEYSAGEKRMLGRAQLIPKELNIYELGVPANIKPVGRMAEWNHKIKIEDVVREATENSTTL